MNVCMSLCEVPCGKFGADDVRCFSHSIPATPEVGAYVPPAPVQWVRMQLSGHISEGRGRSNTDMKRKNMRKKKKNTFASEICS